MVAIFTGAGAGFERGSGSVLGGLGLLGGASLGRGGEQLFLNAANGNLLISRQDEFLVGRGPDASVSRTYNSLAEVGDDNNDNWRQSTDRRVFGLTGTLGTAGSTVKRVSGDGSVIVYSWDASKAAYVATDGAGAHDKLTHVSGVWTWNDGDSQIVETYTAYGTDNWRIATQADTDGNTLAFTYTGANLTRITTANGEYVDYTWSGANITSIVTQAGGTLTRTRYAYDGLNRLTTVTVDLSPEDNAIADGKTYVSTYTYHGSSKLVASISQTDGAHLAIAYDGSNRVSSLTQTVAGGVTRVTTLAYGAGFTTITDPTGQVVRLDYNGDGTLKKITAPPAHAGAAAQVVEFTYTANGDVATVKDALGNVTTHSYDAWGNAVSTTDRLGNVVTRTFGAKNELLTETRTGSNMASASAQHTTRYVYDVENHLRYVISPEGRVTEHRYTAPGQLERIVEYPEHLYDVSGLAPTTAPTETQLTSWRNGLSDHSSTKITLHAYDARGNLITITSFGAATTNGGTTIAEGFGRTHFTYDQSGRLIERNAEGQNSEVFVYDGLGRLVASTDTNGGTTSIVFNDTTTQTVVTLAGGLVRTSTFNKAGELVDFTEAGGFVVGGTATSKYDKNGQLRMTTDATGRNSYHIYDKAGRKVADVDHLGNLIEYRYDANNRLVATTRYANVLTSGQLTTLANPDSVVEMASLRPTGHADDLWGWHVYDKEGRILQAIEGDGSVTAYQYDASGRLIGTTAYFNKLTTGQVDGFKATPPATIVLPTANAAKDGVARSFYDKDGQRVGVLDGEGYLSRAIYDLAGQKVEEVAFFNATSAGLRASGTFNQLLASVGSHANDRRMRYVYDGQGLLRYQVDGFDQVIWYNYNIPRQVTQTVQYAGSIAATSDYTYDNVKALVAASGLDSHAATRKNWSVYDAAGRLAYAIDAENVVAGFTYDNEGRPIKTVHYAVKRTTPSLPALATMNSWAASHAGNTANRVTRHYYSARGEIRFTVDAEGHVTRNDYDAAGRVTREVRWANTISVSDSTTIANVDGLVAGAWVDRNYAYDMAGRLSDAYDGEGNRTRYVYNANGTLNSEYLAFGQSGQARTLFLYDKAGRVSHRYDAHGAAEQAITQYVYDGLGNLVSVTDPNGNVTGRAYDRVGRMTSETRAGATASYEYNAFGEAVKAADPRGHSTYMYYDRLGRAVVVRDAEDHLTQTAYTAFGEVASVTRRYNKAAGTPSVTVVPSVTAHAKDAATAFEYDRLGRLVKTTDAEGHYEQYTLDAFGQRVTVRNKLGANTIYVFDKRGLLVSETLPMASIRADGTTQAASVTNTFEYDARGNRTKTIEAFGLTEQRVTIQVYDKANRLVETRGDAVSVLSQANHNSTSSVTPTELIKYDARGNVIERVDANGGRTLFWHDGLDRVTVSLNALGTYSAYSYDKNGNVLTSRVYDATVSLPGTAGGTAPAAPGGGWRETVHTYDGLDRLKTSAIANLRSGAWSGSAYASTVGTVTTSFDYDAAGNLIKATDGNGAAVFSYYDKLGGRTAQVDQEGYLTAWTLDGEGNVLTERRYATRFTGTPVTTAPPSVSTHADDRVTNFTYDRNGRRLTETRTGVTAWTVNAATGALTAASTSATIAYLYNGLGQITRRTEATDDVVDYSYDATGRLIQETRAPYVDQTSATVRPAVRYHYNGLNDLTMTWQGDQIVHADDRFTRYTYGAGGRLSSMTDAGGAVFNYAYDAAGNMLRESYVRARSDGTTVTEGVLYNRDVLGRITAQALAAWNGSAWIKGDSHNMAYNTHGEVAQRGVNGLWQEQFAYDGAGRLWRSNAGDGVWRYFVYDKSGNRTLSIESAGTDLAGLTIDQALAATTAGGSVGGAYIAGVNVTIDLLDKRGATVQVREPFRQLTSSTTQTLTYGRTYNAFGEVVSETDARGFTTDFTYNAMGRLIERKSPQVAWTSESGAVANARPTETWYYDLSGRLVGTRDANNNLNTRLLLAGTGHGGSEALVSAAFRPDGGVFRTFYDRFGDARILRNELGQDESHAYDAMGRVTSITRRGGLLTDTYTYDLLGQRLRHWNSMLGSGNYEATDYDTQGRVVSTRAFGGDVTTHAYSWSGTLATAGMGTFGGWTVTTTQVNGKTAAEAGDLFGRTVSKTDMGGRVFTFTYDKAGRAVAQGGAEARGWTWFNTGLAATATAGAGNQSTYGYDAGGNRVSEHTTRNHAVVQNATASYDALGRLTAWAEAGNAATPAASKSWQYDLAGNIRRLTASYYPLDANGAPVSMPWALDHWYRYDALHRVVVDKGTLSGSQIVLGTRLTYDAAGQRVTSTQTVTENRQELWWHDQWGVPQYPVDWDPEGGWGWTKQWILVPYNANRAEHYDYRADGALTQVRIGDNGATPQLKATFVYDAMGRLTRQTDWIGNGTNAAYDRYSIVYNAVGQVVSESVASRQGADTWTSYITNSYGTGTLYALGAALTTTTSDYRNGSYQYATTTTNTYGWYDGAVLSQVSYAKTGQPTYNTYYSYTAMGALTSVSINDGRPRTVTYTNDLNGQAIRRSEADTYYAQGDPHEVWYRYAGREVGHASNNSTLETNYTASIENRQKAVQPGTGAFRWGAVHPTGYGEFGQGVSPVNSYAQGGAGGAYTVRTGETLASIAAALWGDASLWYKLAEANGLGGNAALAAGQSLRVPQGVSRATHSASTFRPYDPAEAMGETSPTNPKAPKKANKCGAFGAVLVTVVAVAVAAIVAPPLAGHAAIAATATTPAVAATGLTATLGSALAGGVAGGAIAGVAGSIASQAFGLAAGIQDRFSWKGVALAGISGGIGGGMNGVNLFGQTGGLAKLGSDMVRGALANAAGQGIGLATGLQARFDFAGVAVAGLVSGVGGAAGRGLDLRALQADRSLANITRHAAGGMAGAIAGAAARSLAGGTSFGDNVMAVLPDAIGSTIGNALAYGLAGSGNGHVSIPIRAGADMADASSFNGRSLWDRITRPIGRLLGRIGDWIDGTPDGRFSPREAGTRIGGGAYDMGEIVVTGSRNLLRLGAYDGLAQRVSTVTRSLGNAADQAYRVTLGPGTIYDRIIARPVNTLVGGALNVLSYELGTADNHIRTLGGDIFERRSEVSITPGYLLQAAPGVQMVRATGFAAPASRAAVGAGASTSLEATYHARYVSAYERGLVYVDAEIAAGRMVAPAGQPAHLYRANQVDLFARDDLRNFAALRGDGADIVRINQRLYLEGTSNKYRVPDLYFPQSGMIFDGTLGTKTLNTPQIIDFRAATGNAPIGIVRPEAYYGFYWIRN